LQKYIASYGYEAFTIPRAGAGVGTIVSYVPADPRLDTAHGKLVENIVSTKEEILNLKASQIAVAPLEYSASSSVNLGLNVTVPIHGNINVGGALGSNGITSIQIKLSQPFEAFLSDVQVQTRVGEISKDSSKGALMSLLTRKNDYLIKRVLGASSIEYAFKGSGGSTIKINADILKKINASGDMATKYDGADTIKTDFPVFIGYQLSRITEGPGLSGVRDFAILKVSGEKIQAIKAGQSDLP